MWKEQPMKRSKPCPEEKPQKCGTLVHLAETRGAPRRDEKKLRAKPCCREEKVRKGYEV